MTDLHLEPEYNYRNFQFIKRGLNTAPLLEKINSTGWLWNDIKLRQESGGSPHKYTETIFIRWCKGLDVFSAFNDLEAVDYPAREKLPEVNDLITEVMRETKATKLGRVLITKLQPGADISPHPDEGVVCASYERFHVPLFSREGNLFYCGDPRGKHELVHMNNSELWFFNNKEIHWLKNESSEPRIHLIIDAMAPQFRKDLN